MIAKTRDFRRNGDKEGYWERRTRENGHFEKVERVSSRKNATSNQASRLYLPEEESQREKRRTCQSYQVDGRKLFVADHILYNTLGLQVG